MTDLTLFKKEVDQTLANKESVKILLDTRFKGLTLPNVQAAMLDWKVQGGELEDFFKGDVYAIPFRDSYSLVVSIDYVRKIGMRSGVMGVSAPKYTMTDDGKLESCEITVKRKINGEIGEFTALVYFNEYTTGRNLWATKPMTMISKVAEMHALRKACPEELAQSYVEEEMAKEATPLELQAEEDYELSLRVGAEEAGLAGLSAAWAKLPGAVKVKLQGLKDELKAKLTANAN